MADYTQSPRKFRRHYKRKGRRFRDLVVMSSYLDTTYAISEAVSWGIPNLWQIKGLTQKYRHLRTRDRGVGAEVAAATSTCNILVV